MLKYKQNIFSIQEKLASILGETWFDAVGKMMCRDWLVREYNSGCAILKLHLTLPPYLEKHKNKLTLKLGQWNTDVDICVKCIIFSQVSVAVLSSNTDDLTF